MIPSSNAKLVVLQDQLDRLNFQASETRMTLKQSEGELLRIGQYLMCNPADKQAKSLHRQLERSIQVNKKVLKMCHANIKRTTDKIQQEQKKMMAHL